jgi:DNA repair and recombination RAD54-like protein
VFDVRLWVCCREDWNPASDKQAAGRIWREGQKRRCFIYRFMSTGSIEEKIIQRQLSKEGLQNIVDNTDQVQMSVIYIFSLLLACNEVCGCITQVNQFSTDELRRLFACRTDTNSDTHDTLRCKRCKNVRAIECSYQSKFVLTEQHIQV